MPSKLKYTTLDVFTHSRFKGNPLAIVHIPPSSTLTYDQNLSIAREFNFSETVFLYEPSNPNATEIEISIFMTNAELPFAGHPTVGAGFYILSGMSNISPTTPSTITLKTLSGLITASFDPVKRLTKISVAHDVKIHQSLDCAPFKAQQPHLRAEDYVNGLSGGEPICSIVKGMNFILLELVSIEGLSRLGTFQESVKVPEGYPGEYAGMLGVYAYVKLDTTISADESVITTRLQTRMFDGTLEDPATGSAACAIGSYLAMTMGGRARVRVFEIVQGVEMGRRSEIWVRVTLTDGGAVNKVELEGGAVGVMEGVLTH